MRSIEAKEGYGSVEREEVEGGEDGFVGWSEEKGGRHRREGGCWLAVSLRGRRGKETSERHYFPLIRILESVEKL